MEKTKSVKKYRFTDGKKPKFYSNMKKYSALIISLMISTFVSIGQEKSTSLGFIMSSSGFYYLNNQISGSSFGLGLHYEFRERIFINTGLLNATHQYQHNWVVWDKNDPVLPQQTNLTLSYFSIPIMLGYQFLNTRKWKFSASGGFEVEYQLNETEKSTFRNGSKRKSEFINQNLIKLQTMLKIALGFEYRMGDKFHLEIMPFIGNGGFALQDGFIKTNQIIIGNTLGLYYKL